MKYTLTMLEVYEACIEKLAGRLDCCPEDIEEDAVVFYIEDENGVVKDFQEMEFIYTEPPHES